MADVGQTFNSSLTAEYVARYAAGAAAGSAAGGLDGLINVGDFTYGDNFGIGSTFYGARVPRMGSNPLKWDSWAPMWQPVTGAALLLGVAGNHEMEARSHL